MNKIIDNHQQILKLLVLILFLGIKYQKFNYIKWISDLKIQFIQRENSLLRYFSIRAFIQTFINNKQAELLKQVTHIQ